MSRLSLTRPAPLLLSQIASSLPSTFPSPHIIDHLLSTVLLSTIISIVTKANVHAMIIHIVRLACLCVREARANSLTPRCVEFAAVSIFVCILSICDRSFTSKAKSWKISATSGTERFSRDPCSLSRSHSHSSRAAPGLGLRLLRLILLLLLEAQRLHAASASAASSTTSIPSLPRHPIAVGPPGC